MFSNLCDKLSPRWIKQLFYIPACLLVCLSLSYFSPWGTNNMFVSGSIILRTANVIGEVKERTKTVILMWTNFKALEGDALIKHIISKGKDYSNKCFDGVEVTVDRGQLERATAIVMYHGNLNVSDLPKTRRADQLWVLYGTENPSSSVNLEPYNNMFNWTMTYRRDSDIYAPYGEYERLDKEQVNIEINGAPLDIFIARKAGELVSVILNCDTPGHREYFLSEFRTLGIMPVDIYVACVNRTCGWDSTCDHPKWWAELGAKYKFYFAGEDNICTDYVTEKFWRPLEAGMVPVVYGGAKYSQFAPPNSYIDVREFNDAKDVAKFLKKLDENEIEYKKYFEWRKKYEVKMGDTWQGWCDLSREVKEFREELDKSNDPLVLHELSQTLPDLSGWWDKVGICGGHGISFDEI